MQKPAKLFVATFAILTLGVGGYEMTREKAPAPPLLKTGVPPTIGDVLLFEGAAIDHQVVLRNPKGRSEERHGGCDNPDLHEFEIVGGDRFSWAFGDTCEIGRDERRFTLTVIGFVNDRVILRYDRPWHVHTGWFKREIECPRLTVFSETRDWVSRHKALSDAKVGEREAFSRAIRSFEEVERAAEDKARFEEEERRWRP